MNSKTLDDFLRAERKPKSETIPEGVKVYLATTEAFDKYCNGCSFLVKVEELESGLWRKQVFCKAEKCVK